MTEGTPGEVVALQQRIAELERQRDALQLRVAEFQRVIDALPSTVLWKDREGRFLGGSASFVRQTGMSSLDEVLGKTDHDFPWRANADDYRRDDMQVINSGAPKLKIIEPQQQADGSQRWLETNKVPLRDEDGAVYGILVSIEDITERKNEEEEQLRMQAEIIDSQASALAEMSTPLIPLQDGLLLLPLVGTIDTRRAHQVLEVLLEGINTYQAETAILDITGVRVVDTQVADGLLRAARAAKLLGAQVYLSGISAEVAQTLVQLGANLDQVVTAGTLQSAITTVLQN
jgi:rsbT co-antagonist protein RsbR